MTLKETPPDAVDNDEAWYEVIAGRAMPSRDQPGGREMLALRQAILDSADEALADETLEQDWHKLRFRLRREGLVKPALQPPRITQWVLAATLVMALALGFFVPRDEPSGGQPDVQMRGRSMETRVLRTHNPAAVAAEIMDACSRSKTNCIRREDASGALMIDVSVPKPISQVLTESFGRHSIDLPEGRDVTLVLIAIQ